MKKMLKVRIRKLSIPQTAFLLKISYLVDRYCFLMLDNYTVYVRTAGVAVLNLTIYGDEFKRKNRL